MPYIFNKRTELYTDAVAGNAIVEFQLQWRRPILLIKNLNDVAPKMMYGASTGTIRSSTSGPSIEAPTTITNTPPGIENIVIGGTTYSAFSLGAGISTRQVAPRAWVVDAVSNYTIAD